VISVCSKGGACLEALRQEKGHQQCSRTPELRRSRGLRRYRGLPREKRGEETDKYTANICNTEHAMLKCSAGLPKSMSKSYLVILGFKLDLLTGMYALSIYQK
jgi:hypothetical protein